MALKHLCLILLLSCSITASPVEFIGVPGGHIALPCNLSTEQLDSGRQAPYPDVSLRWSVEERINRSVVQVTPSGITYTARSVGSRVSIRQNQFELGVFSLYLDPLEKIDAGTYHGQVQYGHVKQQCTVVLSIIHVTQSPLGLLPEHGSVTLTCSVAGPSMAPRAVRWLHRGRPVPTSSKMSLSDTKLHLERLTQGDGGEWSCEQDGVRATSTVRVLGISGPPSVSVYAAFGSRMDLPCQLTERTEKEPLVVQWKKILENQSPQLTGDETLSIYPVRTEHAGPYKCDVTYKGHTMSKHVHLKVIQVSPSGPGFVTEGSPLELLCSVSGSEGDERYKWTGPPPQNEVQWGDTLRLPHVRMEDTGAWNCSVLGKRGELGRVQYELYVHAAQIAGQLTPSLPIFMVLTCLVLFGLVAVIAVCLVQQRRWRLSHLALSLVNDPSGSPPKQI